MIELSEKEAERFASKIHFGGPDRCWIWLGTQDVDGYGLFKLNGKLLRAARVAVSLWKKESPEGSMVCHTCDNPPCVNPAHLFLGSAKDNAFDREIKGRGNHIGNPGAPGDRNGSRVHPERLKRGESHPLSKLSERNVQEIRRLYALGNITQTELAEKFGVKQVTISAVITGKVWKNNQPDGGIY